MGSYKADISGEAVDFLADMAGGDARAALNAVELGILTTERSEDGLIHITLDVAQECIQKRAVRYDKGGDNHYDTISAFIKSMRGSDPDAAVYYLARMLYAGEDIKFIARRIMIDPVNTASPYALPRRNLYNTYRRPPSPSALHRHCQNNSTYYQSLTSRPLLSCRCC